MKDHRTAFHLAMSRTTSASQYLAMAWALEKPESWALKMALDDLCKAADALGYQLVKKPDAVDLIFDRLNARALEGRS